MPPLIINMYFPFVLIYILKKYKVIVIFISRDSSILDNLLAESPPFSHHLFPTTLTEGKHQTSCKHTTRTMIFCQELRFIIVSQGIHENRSISSILCKPSFCFLIRSKRVREKRRSATRRIPLMSVLRHLTRAPQ